MDRVCGRPAGRDRTRHSTDPAACCGSSGGRCPHHKGTSCPLPFLSPLDVSPPPRSPSALWLSVVTLPASATDHAHPERPKVKISDVQYDSPGRDDHSDLSPNQEWVEVTNTGRRTVNLDGWPLKDEDGRTYTSDHWLRHPHRPVPGPPQPRLRQPLRHQPPSATTTDASSTTIPGATTPTAAATADPTRRG
ncbi:lamin tail domain-containing protein [Streptomyces sp. NPDC057099]|uniref:lamin tail domain-containing protein n=1 Tax=Streptomyces sp. NPDC057099 TaxID=3346019 RepID=UPI003633EBC8